MSRPEALALAVSPAALQARLRDLAQRIRGMIRGREGWLVVISGFIGVASGLTVALLGTISDHAHRILFGLQGERLSAALQIRQGLTAPIVGGLVLGGLTQIGRAHV